MTSFNPKDIFSFRISYNKKPLIKSDVKTLKYSHLVTTYSRIQLICITYPPANGNKKKHTITPCNLPFCF